MRGRARLSKWPRQCGGRNSAVRMHEALSRQGGKGAVVACLRFTPNVCQLCVFIVHIIIDSVRIVDFPHKLEKLSTKAFSLPFYILNSLCGLIRHANTKMNHQWAATNITG